MYWAAKLHRAIGLGPEATLPDMFAGECGEFRIANTLSKNPAVNEDETVISRLISDGEIVFFRKGDRIIRRGEQDDSVFFLLSGDVDIVFKSGRRSIREAPNQVGEMAAIESGKKRSASVIARSEEVAALQVSSAVFNEIRATNMRFQERLQIEMSARHRERIVASEVAKQDVSLVWFCISSGVGLVVALILWFLLSPEEWALSARLLLSGGGGLLSFVLTLLYNPAFFWRRAFAVTFWAMVGTYMIDWFISIEAEQGVGTLQFEFISGDGEANSVNEVIRAVPFLIVLVVCACMDRLRNRD